MFIVISVPEAFSLHIGLGILFEIYFYFYFLKMSIFFKDSFEMYIAFVFYRM